MEVFGITISWGWSWIQAYFARSVGCVATVRGFTWKPAQMRNLAETTHYLCLPCDRRKGAFEIGGLPSAFRDIVFCSMKKQ